ncbi:MAG: O-antigen ligase family protein [Synechococcales bacterium]|nr:O-antigen ligase family protein [Synechococcales bacterium]
MDGCRRLFRWSLVTLPYLFYASLLGLLVGLGRSLRQFKPPYLDALTLGSLVASSGLLVLSATTALNRGEALLQLANFLPFFALFMVLPSVLYGMERLERFASDWVLAALPINLIAVGEYLLKSPGLPATVQTWPWVEWIRSAPHKGRAMVMFDHPNALASYLVLMLGLGLGLILSRLRRSPTAAQRPSCPQAPLTPNSRPQRRGWLPVGGDLWRSPPDWLIYTATYANLAGIFCSGSRNGVVVAASQLLMFLACTRLNRRLLLGTLVSLGAIAWGIAQFGLGVRPTGLLNLADDPRFGIWEIAIDLTRERPWLGWGLGNFKLLYPPRLIDPEYREIFHTHNFWLLLGVEAGLIVMVLLTVMVGFICYRGVRSLLSSRWTPAERSIGMGYLLAFWGCMGFALFDVTLYDARIQVMNWAILAGIYSLSGVAYRT